MPESPPARDLTRTTLGVLFLAGLLATSFWMLKPFLPALLWATTLVVATWPLMRRLEGWLFGKRWLAIAVMLVVLLLFLVLPFTLAVGTLVDNAEGMVGWIQKAMQGPLPAPPAWLAKVPLVGQSILATWQEIASDGPGGLAARVTPYSGKVATWFVAQAGNFGLLFFDFLLTLVIAAILFARGEIAADGVLRFADRLAGGRGTEAARLAALAVRGVALGVVVTALVQALLGGLGLVIAGLPAAPILTALMFILSIAQIGAAPVLACAALWLWFREHTGWAITLGIWTIVVGSLDNVLRPILIKKGAQLPLLLVFAGVIGGLVAFGPIGLFVGPVILAVAFTLLAAWTRNESDTPSVGTS